MTTLTRLRLISAAALVSSAAALCRGANADARARHADRPACGQAGAGADADAAHGYEALRPNEDTGGAVPHRAAIGGSGKKPDDRPHGVFIGRQQAWLGAER